MLWLARHALAKAAFSLRICHIRTDALTYLSEQFAPSGR